MTRLEAIRLKSGGVRALVALMAATECSSPAVRARVSELAETWLANYVNLNESSSDQEIDDFDSLDTDLFSAVQVYAKDDPDMQSVMDSVDSPEGIQEFLSSLLKEATAALRMSAVVRIVNQCMPPGMSPEEVVVFEKVGSMLDEIDAASKAIIHFNPSEHEDDVGTDLLLLANTFIETNHTFRTRMMALKEVVAARANGSSNG